MKTLPDIDLSFAPLNRMILGIIQSKLLTTGIELKIFNRLQVPISFGALARETCWSVKKTKRFLDSLAACDLVKKNQGLYQNSPLAQTFLITSSPAYLGEMLTSTAQMFDTGLADLAVQIKNRETGPEADTIPGFETMGQSAADSMARVQSAGFARMAADIVSKLPEFYRLNRMLDLGGGPGLTGMAIVAAHPNMTGIIFDFPLVIEKTARYIASHQMSDRVKSLGGDFKIDTIGHGYDLIWAAGTLHFAKQDLNQIMGKIHHALNPGGVCISLHDGLTKEGTKPETSVLSQLPMTMMNFDIGLAKGEISAAMLKAGFQSVQSCPMKTSMGQMDLDIARKNFG